MSEVTFCIRGHGHTKGKKCARCATIRRKANRAGADAPPPTCEERESRLASGPELERLRKKNLPTDSEWSAIQEAAEMIRAVLQLRAAGGGKRYAGRTAWEIIEAATDTPVRFQQLCAMATLLNDVGKPERIEGMKIHSKCYNAETVAKVRALRKDDYSHTTIAAKLGIPRGSVSKILNGETHRVEAA